MKLHDRYFIVAAAQVDLNMAVTRIAEQHGLTYIELLYILSQTQARWVKAALQDERETESPDGA